MMTGCATDQSMQHTHLLLFQRWFWKATIEWSLPLLIKSSHSHWQSDYITFVYVFSVWKSKVVNVAVNMPEAHDTLQVVSVICSGPPSLLFSWNHNRHQEDRAPGILVSRLNKISRSSEYLSKTLQDAVNHVFSNNVSYAKCILEHFGIRRVWYIGSHNTLLVAIESSK